MSSVANTASPEATGQNELVDDRALESVEGDRLRHRDLATELAEVVSTVRAPASIALWGPWGSGKSGLANLLKEELAGKAPKARFVRFDAFKFAETPLRRHFISQVAEALGITSSEFRDGLYSQRDKTTLEIPRWSFIRLLVVFLLVLLTVELAAFLLILLIAAVSPGSFESAFHDLLRGGLALALAPAGILAAFTALAGQTLPVKRTRSAPSTDEEFERIFKKLVKRVAAQPLVVFIDELDRCSPDEVVSTLEAIRTFLDVRGVVYVVAADQQVLERALREAARQTTPPDSVNPYYSAGSAYLDKIFQYQFSVPPMMTRGLSEFALDLTADLDGVWKTIDRARVLSVLIPTHVRSPRRVKRLLNGFVLTYRLARRRAQDKRVNGPVENRAAEIAKLVCLQIEFPLFAADLSLEPRLPEYVLAVHRGEQLPNYLPAEVRNLAVAYAHGRLNVDEIIAVDTLISRDGEGTAAQVDPDSQVESEQPLEERPEEEGGSEVARVGRAHAEQLIRYLQKARHISGPKSDLVYMESRAALFGLDPTVADSLGDAASDGDIDEVRRIIGQLGEPELQRSALQLLAQRGREAAIGIGGRNAVSCLLVALSELSELNLEGIADVLADAVAVHEESDYRLQAGELGGALSLATVSSRGIGKRLMELVLSREETTDTALGAQVVADAAAIPSEFGPRVADIAASRLVEEPAAIVDRLVALEDGALMVLLANTADRIQDKVEQSKKADEATEEQ
jgi:hypothetical protein